VSNNNSQNIIILKKMESKLSANLKQCLEKEDLENFNDVEVKARAFAVLGQILNESEGLSPHQKEIIPTFDEIFSDIIISLYFAACSLDNPAQIILRRVLELGVAIVYLWDYPIAFWGWKNHDKDLKFNEMIEYLASDTYKTFIQSINQNHNNEYGLLIQDARNSYRRFSNTLHGKIVTFESTLTDRFTYNSEDWHSYISLVKKVQEVLLNMYGTRFYECFTELYQRLPSLSRSDGEGAL